MLFLSPSNISSHGVSTHRNDSSWSTVTTTFSFFLPMDSTCSYSSLSHTLYNTSYPGARPAQESKGVAIHRWRHQVHAHRPPVLDVPLGQVETSFHLAALQPHDQEALCKVVHGLKPVAGKLWHIEGGGLVVTVQQNALVEREKCGILAWIWVELNNLCLLGFIDLFAVHQSIKYSL